jgi:Pyridoxamine 5'-phosphate oxidase
MRWSEIDQGQPRLAELGRRLLIEPGVVLVGTTRRDGTPRISPVEPYILNGELMLSMMWGSRKAADLLRDPRILVHSIVVSRDGDDGEFKVRGTATRKTIGPCTGGTPMRSPPAWVGSLSPGASTCSPS